MSTESPLPPEIEKPLVLYHASQSKHIDEFEPRRGGYRDPGEGPVVFATPDKAYATLFLVKSNDSWTFKGRYSEAGVKGPWHIIISDKDRFVAADKGGSIYSFDPNNFSFDPHRNMGSNEWTSHTPVSPIGEEYYPSGLEAMKSAGVEVYFVDAATFSEIKNSEDYGYSILASLNPEP